jgi:hypothetical protein
MIDKASDQISMNSNSMKNSIKQQAEKVINLKEITNQVNKIMQKKPTSWDEQEQKIISNYFKLTNTMIETNNL